MGTRSTRPGRQGELCHTVPAVPHTPKNSLAWENNGTKEQPRHSASPRESCTKPAGEQTSIIFQVYTIFLQEIGEGFKFFWGFSPSKNSSIWVVKITGSDLAGLFTLWIHYHKQEDFLQGFHGLKVVGRDRVRALVVMSESHWWHYSSRTGRDFGCRYQAGWPLQSMQNHATVTTPLAK